MKLSFLFAFIFLLTIAQVSALSTDIKQTYESKETIIVKIVGDVVNPIASSQVIFKRNNVFVPLEYDVKRLGQNWYVWAIAPATSGTYTFILDNIVTSSGSGVKTEDYQKNFNITSNTTKYNINPGFIFADSEFDINIEVFDESQNTISSDFPSTQDISVELGQNIINFPIEETNSGLHIIHLGKYSVPIYLTTGFENITNVTQNQTNQTQLNNNSINNTIDLAIINITNVTQNQTNQTQLNNNSINNTSTNFSNSNMFGQEIFFVDPGYIQRFMYKQAKSSTYTFTITNPSNASYKNIQILYNESLFELDDNKFNLKAKENYSFTITLGKYPGYNVRELIYLNATNMTVEIPFFVRYTENASEIASFYGEIESNTSINGTKKKTNYVCTDLGGIVCPIQSQCKGESLTSKEGNCCLGVCQQPAGSGPWWGWIIGIAAVAILIFIYMKYKKASPSSETSLDISGIS